jgi:lipoprotein Spr
MVFRLQFFLFCILILFSLASCSSRKGGVSRKEGVESQKTENANSNRGFAAEYSKKLGVPVPENSNQVLISTISEWIGTPYKYGGNDKRGVDCSGFIHIVYPMAYNVKVPRSSAQLYKEAQPVSKSNLREGDIVFFKINTKEVGHSGIYLFDNYFVHASSSRGVMISRLEETYWNKYFVGGGRFSR